MSNHRILASVAAALSSAAPAAVAATPVAPAPSPAPSASNDETVDVVTLETAQQHGREQFAAGSTAERQRTADVFASDAGKANPQMAAFMLANNPTATAPAIVTQLSALPAAATSAAAAPAPAPAEPAPAAPAAITTPLNAAAPVDVAPNATAGGGADDVIDMDAEIARGVKANAAAGQRAMLEGGIPATGN